LELLGSATLSPHSAASTKAQQTVTAAVANGPQQHGSDSCPAPHGLGSPLPFAKQRLEEETTA